MASQAWRDRLAAASVLRALPGWRLRGRASPDGRDTSSSLPEHWRQESAEQLNELTSAGIEVDLEG